MRKVIFVVLFLLPIISHAQTIADTLAWRKYENAIVVTLPRQFSKVKPYSNSDPSGERLWYSRQYYYYSKTPYNKDGVSAASLCLFACNVRSLATYTGLG